MNKPINISRSLELVSIGDAVGVVLPPDLLERLGVAPGDRLRIADTPDGFEMEPEGRESGGQMPVAREVMRRRREALAELAK